MATFRTVKESGDFVTVHKSFVYDKRLSAKSKGILLYFLSRPDDWQIYTSEVVKHMQDGQKSINNGIKELIENGYVKRKQKRNDAGIFNGYEYLVYERPTEMPLSENGLSENGLSENGKGLTTNNDRTNNDLTNNNLTVTSSNSTIPYKEIVNYLNKQSNKSYRDTSNKTRKLIDARYNQGFDINDFKKVIENMTSAWIDDKKMNMYLRPETLFGTKFESYLNQKINTDNVKQPKKETDDFLERKRQELMGG